MITPFAADGSVDFDAHVANMEKWNEADLGGYLALGSNSEAAYLNEAEKLRLVELTVKHAKKGRIVLAGTGMESTQETIRLTNKAAALGAHAALVLTPSYYGGKMNDEALVRFFSEVADHAEIPVLIYNVTKFTHVNISPKAVGELAKHPNIVGMKDSAGDIAQLVKFKSVITENFNLILGTASVLYPALTLGIKAAIMALANCAPGECAKVQEYYDRGDESKARELYLELFPVNQAVTETYGVAGLKYACELRGYRGGSVRSPLLPVKDEDKPRIADILKRAELA
jgi:4-hydroxy-2-oxoglutarate aldolase